MAKSITHSSLSITLFLSFVPVTFLNLQYTPLNQGLESLCLWGAIVKMTLFKKSLLYSRNNVYWNLVAIYVDNVFSNPKLSFARWWCQNLYCIWCTEHTVFQPVFCSPLPQFPICSTGSYYLDTAALSSITQVSIQHLLVCVWAFRLPFQYTPTPTLVPPQ